MTAVDVLPRLAALGVALLLVGCSSSSSSSSSSSAPAKTPTVKAASPSTSPSAPPPLTPTPAGGTGPTLLALGDSVAAGVGADDPARRGYVPLLAGLLRTRLGCDEGPTGGCPVQLLAVPGATTPTLVRDQLPTALDLLRKGDVRVVTVTIGGNDVFAPVLRACARAPQTPTCAEAVRRAVGAVDQGVAQLLAELESAAGPRTTVAVMTYYDPLPACRLAPLSPLAQQVLEGTGGTGGLNDVLRTRAAEHGAVVVETQARLRAPEDFVGGLDCLHPSTSGHARIAEAFAAALSG